MPTQVKQSKMYLILREDLAYKYIQGGHALAAFALNHPYEFKEWNNEYLICVSVFNGMALDEICKEFCTIKAHNKNFKFSKFIEPDLKSELPTAIAMYASANSSNGEYIKHLSLATK